MNKMKELDIVYILKNDYSSDELKYSLRSVEKNFPHRKIWFYGGKPEGIEPDGGVYFHQLGADRYEKVNRSLRRACYNDEISDNFFLFNDDFFILSPVEKFEPLYSGSINEYARGIEAKVGRTSNYTNMMKNCSANLHAQGCTTYNYAVHLPFLINRWKAIQILKAFPKSSFRNYYGNIYAIGGKYHPDVKIMLPNLMPNPEINETYLSTSDRSFREGLVGKYIRKSFPEKCRYEI